MSNVSMSARTHLEEELLAIRQGVMRMGECVGEMVRLACDAACQSDSEIARQVVVMDDTVDRLEEESVRQIVLCMMRHAPVASDLKFLTSTLGVVHEVEQAADDVVKLARRTIKLTGQFPGEMKADLSQLGERTRTLFARSLKLFLDFNDELANEVVSTDQEIDSLYKDARNRVVVMLQNDPERTRQLIRVIAAFHSLEHVADHAVEIAKRLKSAYGRDEALSSSTPA